MIVIKNLDRRGAGRCGSIESSVAQTRTQNKCSRMNDHFSWPGSRRRQGCHPACRAGCLLYLFSFLSFSLCVCYASGTSCKLNSGLLCLSAFINGVRKRGRGSGAKKKR